MTTKHTPPPWRKGFYSKPTLWTDIINPKDHAIIKVKTHRFTAPYTSEPDPRGMANFRLVLTAPKLLNKLVGILRYFDRDNIPAHFELRPSGKGVRIFITYAEVKRIRDLIKEVTP